VHACTLAVDNQASFFLRRYLPLIYPKTMPDLRFFVHAFPPGYAKAERYADEFVEEVKNGHQDELLRYGAVYRVRAGERMTPAVHDVIDIDIVFVDPTLELETIETPTLAAAARHLRRYSVLVFAPATIPPGTQEAQWPWLPPGVRAWATSARPSIAPIVISETCLRAIEDDYAARQARSATVQGTAPRFGQAVSPAAGVSVDPRTLLPFKTFESRLSHGKLVPLTQLRHHPIWTHRPGYVIRKPETYLSLFVYYVVEETPKACRANMRQVGARSADGMMADLRKVDALLRQYETQGFLRLVYIAAEESIVRATGHMAFEPDKAANLMGLYASWQLSSDSIIWYLNGISEPQIAQQVEYTHRCRLANTPTPLHMLLLLAVGEAMFYQAPATLYHLPVQVRLRRSSFASRAEVRFRISDTGLVQMSQMTSPGVYADWEIVGWDSIRYACFDEYDNAEMWYACQGDSVRIFARSWQVLYRGTREWQMDLDEWCSRRSSTSNAETAALHEWVKQAAASSEQVSVFRRADNREDPMVLLGEKRGKLFKDHMSRHYRSSPTFDIALACFVPLRSSISRARVLSISIPVAGPQFRFNASTWCNWSVPMGSVKGVDHVELDNLVLSTMDRDLGLTATDVVNAVEQIAFIAGTEIRLFDASAFQWADDDGLVHGLPTCIDAWFKTGSELSYYSIGYNFQPARPLLENFLDDWRRLKQDMQFDPVVEFGTWPEQGAQLTPWSMAMLSRAMEYVQSQTAMGAKPSRLDVVSYALRKVGVNGAPGSFNPRSVMISVVEINERRDMILEKDGVEEEIRKKLRISWTKRGADEMTPDQPGERAEEDERPAKVRAREFTPCTIQ